MERRKIAGWIYGSLLVACAFAVGFFAGQNQTKAQVQVTVVQAETAAPEPATYESAEPAEAVTYPIDLNTADQAALETLPGIGPELAARILAYRETVGRFVSKEQIMDVSGIGEKRYAEMEQLITVEVTP